MFLIYVTSKGELPSYIQLFFYSPPSGQGSAPAAAPAGVNPQTGQTTATPSTPLTANLGLNIPGIGRVPIGSQSGAGMTGTIAPAGYYFGQLKSYFGF
jgi:hypothetical protein